MKKIFVFLSLIILPFILVSCENEKKILVAYFSCTGNTEKIAYDIVDLTHADIFKIEAEIEYAEEDLTNYTGGRCMDEQNDPNSRPQIKNKNKDISDYSKIFLGYPIWFGDAPKIIYTFLESYDLTDITIIPFSTSDSGNIGDSANNLKELAPNSIFLEAGSFTKDSTNGDVGYWLSIGLGLY